MPVKNRDVSSAAFRLSDFLPYRLAVTSASVSRLFTESCAAPSNLTIAEWRTLAVVAQYGTLSPTAVGQFTAMDKAKVSRAAQSLTGKGMLRQSQDPGDGRARLLRLTRKGVVTHTRMVACISELEAEMFDDVSQADVAALRRVLTKLGSRLESYDGTDSEVPC
jgi:DNA-binding MarR family transcriptional regulator